MLSTTGFAADLKIALGTVQGNGKQVAEEKLNTLRSLLKSEIDEHEKSVLLDDASAADFVLNADLNRLEQSYILVLVLKNSKESRTRKTKLEDFDEIDVAVKRLVAAVVEDKDLEDTAERGVILDKEQSEPTRMNSIGGTTLSFGVAVPVTNAIDSHKAMFAFAGGYSWDLQRFLLELRGDSYIGYDDAGMNTTSFSVGGHYVFSDTRMSAVYSGIDLGFIHIAKDLLDDKSGFSVAGNLGVILLRYADINVDLRLRVQAMADKFNGKVPVFGAFLVGLRF